MCRDVVLELSKKSNDVLWSGRPWQSTELHTVSLSAPQPVSFRVLLRAQAKHLHEAVLLLLGTRTIQYLEEVGKGRREEEGEEKRREKRRGGRGEEEGGEKYRFAANDISGERERHDWRSTTTKQLSLKSHQFKLLHRASEKLDIT